MQRGLIPVTTYETLIVVKDSVGIVLENSSIQEIITGVRLLAKLPEKSLKEMSYNSWEYTQKNHTKEKIKSDFIHQMNQIVSIDHKKTTS